MTQTISGVGDSLWVKKGAGLYAPTKRRFPIYGLVLYLPLWHPELSGSPIVSKDLNAHSCAVVGAIHQPPLGRAFDGDDYVNLSTHIADFESLTEGTILLWVKPSDVTLATEGLISMSHTADPSSDCSLRLTLDEVGITVREGSVNALALATNARNLVNNTWYQVGFAVNSSGNAIYVNGSAAAVTYGTGDASTQAFYNNILTPDSFLIGMNEDVGGLQWDFEGYMGEVWIFSRALSTAEILHIYNATKWRYL